MNIFSRIFRKTKPPEGKTERAEILGGGSSFSAWNGDAYANDIYRGAVDAIARNVAKLKGSICSRRFILQSPSVRSWSAYRIT